MTRVLMLLLVYVVSPFHHALAGDQHSQVQEKNVRAHMEFLASDALKGRGSATEYELIAAHYIASQFRQFGLAPAGDRDANQQKTFLQTIPLTKQAFAEVPALRFQANGQSIEWRHGREMACSRLASAEISGPFQKLEIGGTPQPGAFVLLNYAEEANAQEIGRNVFAMLQQGAAAVMIATPAEWQPRWERFAAGMPELPTSFGAASGSRGGGSAILLNTAAANAMQQIPDGVVIQISGSLAPPEIKHTWNVVGELAGSDPKRRHEAISLSAHMDHLGVRRPVAGDSIYNGADDDASGVIAVLELARVLSAGPRPKRTIYFVAYGSEEQGGFGSRYFIEHPPLPLENLVANIQFEMIGRPDPKVAAHTLWLTGFERSNLGPELAQRGARLVADPHPQENFFQRSDNYILAKRGIIAHTVSSYGLHEEYHQPNDDLTRIDFAHMTAAINAIHKPVLWLANSDFKPAWVAGKNPAEE